MAENVKRRGRPFVAPEPGKRSGLTILVRPEIKAALEAAAKASGRTQSSEAEAWFEELFTYRAMLKAMNTDLVKLTAEKRDREMRRLGFTVRHTSVGPAYLPPGYQAPASDWIEPDEEEQG